MFLLIPRDYRLVECMTTLIPLLPDVVPVNSRPYRYSPHHKDEIEQQVREMIQSGFMVPSTSPFTGIACAKERWQQEVLCRL